MLRENSENVAHRKRAVDSLRSILEFLRRPDAVGRFLQSGTKFELNLEKNVPDSPYHKNLVLVFEPTLTSGGAKFSLRDDGRFTITIYVPWRNTKEMWLKAFPNHVRDMLLGRRSSYIHEFTHYLDIRDQQLDKIAPPDPHDNKQYYNHPWEVRAFIQQGLSDIEDAVEVKLLNKWPLWVREFGMTEDQFVTNAQRKYMNPEFLRYLTPENKRLVEEELRSLFHELVKALRQKPEEISEDNVKKRIIQPPLTPNLTLKMAYQDQKDQEEADKDMSKKAIMQYVSEITRMVVNEAFGDKGSNSKDGKEWKDIDKLDKSHEWLPKDEPDQKEASKKSRKLTDMFAKMDNLGGINMPFGESSTFGSDSFQGSNYGFGGKGQLTDPVQHMPPEEDDTEEMQLPSARDRGGLGNPSNKPDGEFSPNQKIGSPDLTDDAPGLRLYNSLTEFMDGLDEEAIAGAEDFSMSAGVGTGGASQGSANKTVNEEDIELDERTESDALYRDLMGMAIDPDSNDKNFDPEPPAPEEYGADHHVGGMNRLIAPHRFIPAGTDTSPLAMAKAKARLAEKMNQARIRKLRT